MQVRMKNPAGYYSSTGVHYRPSKRNALVEMPDELFAEVKKCRNITVVTAPGKASAEDAADQTAAPKAEGKAKGGKGGKKAAETVSDDEPGETEGEAPSDAAKAAIDAVMSGK